MEDFGRYIFVILAVVSAIVSIIQKSKKNEKQEGKPLSQPETPKWIEEIFGEITEEKPKQKQQPSVNTTRVEKSKQVHPISSFASDKSRQTTSAHKLEMLDSLATRTQTHIKHIELPSEEEVRHFDVELNSANDWQRAFVYSEIFQRKY